MTEVYIDRPWERAGITYRQFDHWVTKGYMPGGNPGNGYRREYTREEYSRLKQMADLVRFGMKPEAAYSFVATGKAPAIIAAMKGE